MRHLVPEKENSEFKPVKLRLKIDLVSYPDRSEGLVNMVIQDCLDNPEYSEEFWKPEKICLALTLH